MGGDAFWYLDFGTWIIGWRYDLPRSTRCPEHAVQDWAGAGAALVNDPEIARGINKSTPVSRGGLYTI
jgi:hypothetical protein